MACCSSLTSSLVQLVDQALELVSSHDSADSDYVAFADVMKEVPTINLSPLLPDSEADEDAVNAVCKQIVDSLHKYGILVVRDPRMSTDKGDEFLNMMEQYFDSQQKSRDVRPDLHYQVGATPENTETARNHCDKIQTLDPSHQPQTPCPPEADPKWRYFWKLKAKQQSDREQSQHTEGGTVEDNVIPDRDSFPKFESLCNEIGGGLLDAAHIICQGVAMGIGQSRTYFTDRMADAPHLLAPTATDLNKFGEQGTVIAGYHYDLNLLTVHGKSRYEGLYIWLRDGRKVKVKIPDGYLLCQAAKQLEWITAGHIFAGYHEVVVDEGTQRCIEKWKRLRHPLWRISMTMFAHFRGDVQLQIMERFRTEEMVQKYPQITAYEQVMQELKAIGLAVDDK